MLRQAVDGPQAAARQHVTAALITAALPANPRLPATWPTFAALLPHVLAALPLTSEPVHRAATYLGDSGSYTTARDLQQQILTAGRHDLGAEHPDTLAARANLAEWTGMAGDAAAAATSSPRCCLSASGCSVPKTRAP
jgi:hypothetical protein